MDQLDLGGAQPVRLDLDPQQLAGLQLGAADAPAVLLVPGYTGSKEDFGPILGLIAAAGFRAVAIDLPGQFESPPMPTVDDYTPERLAPVVLAACAALGPGTRLLGHSFGGLVARAAVLAAPSAVRSLVLLSSGPADLGGARRTLVELLAPVLAEGGLPAVYAAMVAVGGEDPARSPELAAFLQHRFLTGSADMLTGMGTALRTEPDRVAALAATGVPVLVTHGATDDAWPADVQHDMATRLGARYAVIPDAAHSAAIENPWALVPVLLDFWQTVG